MATTFPPIVIETDDAADRRRIALLMSAQRPADAAVDELSRRRAERLPAVVVAWPRRPAAESVARLRAIGERFEGVPLVAVVSTSGEGVSARKALRAGAAGIVHGSELDRTLPVIIDAVRLGLMAVPRTLRRHVVREPLSHREKQVLGMVVTGLTNRQIADRLFLAESTVKTHLSSAFVKLETRSRAEAAALILDPDEGLGPSILGLQAAAS